MSLKKVVCFVMAFVLLVLNIPFVSSAVEERDESAGITLPPTENTSLQDVYGNIPIDSEPIYEYDIPASEEIWQLGPDEMSYAELQAIKFEDVVFPEVISVEKAEEKGHVNRLKAQEKNLNSIIYQNRDGGKTAYIYDYPVKYYDADGNVRDRSTRIESNIADGYAYSMWDNSVQAHFSQNSSGGVLLSSGEISIKMTPISSSVGQNAVQANDNTVIYGKVFDGSVILVYTSLMSGIKEDIVLSHFGGQNSFEFSLEADGLEALEQSNGIWVLVSGDTVVAEFERIVINDSAGNTVYGEMDIQPASDGSYTITVSAPLDFLESEETVYPVYIDPTLYIWETNSYYTGYDDIPYDSIIDVGLYETQDDYDYNWDTYHIFVLGSCDGMEGEGKIIYKLPDFYNSEYGLYTDMRREQISSAMLYIETMSDEGMSVYAYPMTSTYTEGAEEPIQLWDAELSSAYDANKGIYSYLTSTGLQEVNITSIVQGWADFNNGLSSAASDNPMNGFVLAASNPAYGISIKSTEYGSAGSDAYVMIDYSPIGGEYYIVNTNAVVSLQGDAWESTIPYVDKLSTSVENRWLIEYIGGGKHVIRSLSDTDYSLSSLTGSPRIAGGLVGNTEKWQIVSAGGGFRLKNVSNAKYLYTNGTTLSFVANTDTSEGSRWGLVLKSEYVHITDIELNDDWIKPGQTKYFDVKSTPSNATWRGLANFTWTVSNSSVVDTTDNTGYLIGVSSGVVTLTLTHKITGFTKSFRIVCGTIREGTYMIKNKGTSRYMDVEGPSMSSGAYIQQWDYHTGNQEKWIVTMHYNGGYCIMSGYSANYVTVNNSSSVTGTAIIQSETFDDEYSMWNIAATSGGSYKILSAPNPNLAISVPIGDNQNGTDLILSTYTNNTNYYDEWIFGNAGETPGIVDGGIYNIQAVHSQKVIDVEYGSKLDGTNISQYTLTAGYQWQRWKFNYIGNGEYKIYDMNSGKLLSVADSSANTHANIELMAADGSTGQVFRIRQNEDGTYTFLSQCSYYAKALEIANASQSNSANIEQNNDNGMDNQKFNLLESVPDIDFLIDHIGELYTYAKAYRPEYNSQKQQALVMQYIRHNTNYVGVEWAVVAGIIDQGFVDYVNGIDPLMNVIFSGDRVSINSAGTSAASFIYDGFGNEVDFYHLIATMNGLIYNTVDVANIVVDEEKIDYLCGWAGDLQSFIEYNIFPRIDSEDDYVTVYDETLALLGNENTRFSITDLRSDADAVNIYNGIMRVGFLESFEKYYDSEYIFRYNNFAPGDTRRDIYDVAREFTDNDYIYLMEWPFLLGLEIEGYQADAFADAFAEWLWGLMLNEIAYYS